MKQYTLGYQVDGITPITIYIVNDPAELATVVGSKEGDFGLCASGPFYRRDVNSSVWVLKFAGGGASTWGAITGTLGDQIDLDTALGGKAASSHTHAQGDITSLVADLAGKAASVHSHAIADITALQGTLDAKQPLDTDLTTIAGLTATTDNFLVSAASAWASRTPAQAKTSLALVKGDVGLGSVDNTTDAAKPVSTATQTALDLKAPLASPTLTGVPVAPTAAVGTNTTQLATTAYARAMPLDTLTAPTDVLTLNASITAHGLLPKLDNVATNFLTGTGTWAVPAGGGGVSDGDKGDIVVSAGATVWTVDTAAVTLAKMADMATASLLGRNTAAVGVPEVLSATTARALLNVADGANNYVHPNHTGNVTSVTDGATTIAAGVVTEAMQVLADNVTQDVSITKHGYVPKAPNISTQFLRGDATWAVPAGGGGAGVSMGAIVASIAGMNLN